jgi:glycopeptide antibiotics resistance protein
MRLTDGTRRARLTFVLDLVAIVAFVLVGMRSHRSGNAVLVFARTAAPVLVAWIVCAFWFRTYRPPTQAALVKTILVAVPLGILVRTAVVGSPEGWRVLTFLGVALLFLALFVGTARVIASLVGRRWEEPA